jgi:hypothetical protein
MNSINNIINWLSGQYKAIFLVLLFGTLLGFRVSSQTNELKMISPVMGNEVTFLRYKSDIVNAYIYCNTQYNLDKIRKDYPSLDPLGSDYFSVYINSHDVLMNTIKSVFSQERLNTLANEKAILTIVFQITQEGFPLMVTMGIDSLSSITPFELEKLEQGMLLKLSFIPYDIRVNGNASKPEFFQINFYDIQNGTIKDLINNERAYMKRMKGGL